MSLIDDIKRDREAGTPGPWRIVPYDAGDVSWWSQTPMIDGPEEYDCAVVHWAGFEQQFWQSAHGDRRAIEANARRIARVPQLEAMTLAGEAMAEAATHAAASLVAAISLLERGGCKAAPSDKMFRQMLKDYKNAVDAYRAALAAWRKATENN